MKAKDVMTTRLVTVTPDTDVRAIATLLIERHISAVPVTDGQGKLLGIVSEGDLLHRAESDTTPKARSWWLGLFSDPSDSATDYAKVHGMKARDVMTENVVTVTEDTPLADIAELLESRNIKRVPVVRDGKPVGIVSRANLLQGLVAARETLASIDIPVSDETIRQRILDELKDQDWASVGTTNVLVSDGVVTFWGAVASDAERRATRALAEGVPGVKSIEDKRGTLRLSAY